MKSTLFPDGVLKICFPSVNQAVFPDEVLEMCFPSVNQAVFPDGNMNLLVLEYVGGEVYDFFADRMLESDAQGMQMKALFAM